MHTKKKGNGFLVLFLVACLTVVLVTGCGGGGGGVTPTPVVTYTVSGTVTQNGNPVNLAQVTAVEPAVSTTTNTSGNFSLEVPSTGTITIQVTNTASTLPQISGSSQQITVEGDTAVPTITVPAAPVEVPGNNAPTVASFTCSPTSGNYPLVVNCACSGTDVDAGDTIYYNASDTVSFAVTGASSGNFSVTYSAAANATAYCTVVDNHGESSAQSSVAIAITTPPAPPPVNNVPTISAFTANPTSGTVPLAVTFTVTATDADSDTLTYDYNFGNGTIITGSSSNNPSHTFTTAGTYTVQTTVKDGKGGQVSSTVSVTASNPSGGGGNTAPTLTSVTCVANSITVGDSSTCTPNGAADADAGDTVTCNFDFGDGTVVTGQPCAALAHTYATANTYTVTVTPVDNHALAGTSRTTTVTVANPAQQTYSGTKWGSLGTGVGQYDDPRDMDVDSSGNVYVVDQYNNRVDVVNSSGSHVAYIGPVIAGTTNLDTPEAVCISPVDGSIAVVETGGPRIIILNAARTYVREFGSYGTGDVQFDTPRGCAFDSAGNLYVVDDTATVGNTTNHRVQKINPNTGVLITKWGSRGVGNGSFYNPIGIEVDSSDNVYVVEATNNRVQKFTSAGVYVAQWGGTGTGNGKFSFPYYIGIDSSNRVYVIDYGNDRVQVFSNTGAFLYVIGSSGAGDGQFTDAVGIAVTPAGIVYVSDYTKDNIQKFIYQ